MTFSELLFFVLFGPKRDSKHMDLLLGFAKIPAALSSLSVCSIHFTKQFL